MMVQVESAAVVPPVSMMDPLPATAVTVPPQLLTTMLGVETTSPAGSVSVKATPVKGIAWGLPSVNVRVVVWPIPSRVAPNILLMDWPVGPKVILKLEF